MSAVSGGRQKKCRVAFIGAGKMAREHMRAFADMPGVELAGIFSRTRRHAEALVSDFGVETVCDSIGELYEKTKADLAVIAVVETAANEISRGCFEYPWAVLMEKPPGLNLREAREIRKAAADKKRSAYVALNRRFLSSTLAAAEDLKEDRGSRFLQLQDQEDLVAAAARYPKAILDNWMYANSIHVIDYLRIFGRGPIRKVTPILPWDPRKPGVVAAAVEFSAGDAGLYTAIWNGPGPWHVSVSTPQIRWELRPLEQAAFQKCNERKLHPVEPSTWDHDFKPGFRKQAEEAVAAAMGRPGRLPTLDDAVETMELIAAIYGHAPWKETP